MDLLISLPGADRVLAAHARLLPQPDQLCGPFSAHVALHAVLADPPSTVDLARAAGTAVWRQDVPAWRPAGAPLVRTGWDALPAAATPDGSGTNAAGLAAAVEALTDVVVVPAAGPGDVEALLTGLAVPVGVLANVRTGAFDPTWDVGHFVVLHAVGDGVVGVADTYPEVGHGGRRVVPGAQLAAALPGRGLLLLARPGDAAAVRGLVDATGFSAELWTT